MILLRFPKITPPHSERGKSKSSTPFPKKEGEVEKESVLFSRAIYNPNVTTCGFRLSISVECAEEEECYFVPR